MSNYRYDPDLEFLRNIPSKQLDSLVYILTTDADGEKRFNESLTSSPAYQHYAPDHNKYWQNIAGEIQLYGGNTIVSIFRGNRGVLYREVLSDVFDKLKIKFSKSLTTAQNEQILLEHFRQLVFKRLNTHDQDRVRALLTQRGLSLEDVLSEQRTARSATSVAVYSVVVTLVLRSLFTRIGMSSAFTLGGGELLSLLAGPVGWVVAGIWGGIDIAGPAYRVTIPACLQIAILRLKSGG